MNYDLLLAAIPIDIYTFTYGLWLKKQGNKTGAYFIYLLVGSNIGLAIYRILTGL